MSKWLGKNILWMNFVALTIICLCGAFGVKGLLFCIIIFVLSAPMAFLSILATEHSKLNFAGVVAWTLMAVYSGLMLIK